MLHFALTALLIGFLETILSLDNALVLAMQVKRVAQKQQKSVLTYGLFGAAFFRFVAVFIGVRMLEHPWIKLLGAAYLLWFSIKHLLLRAEEHKKTASRPHQNFWKTVLLIEVTDIVFAIDSILAAVALTRNVWLVFVGGFMGVIATRFSARQMMRWIEAFPHLESSAYLLILIIGVKVALEGFGIGGEAFDSPRCSEFWIFWGLIALILGRGFLARKIQRR